VPDHAGFAAAITVREHVLRTALQAGYANGSDSGKKFVEDLSDGEIGMEPDLFLGQPDINCEGATNLLVATLPMRGQVTVTANQVPHVVDVTGEMEMTLTPTFTTGPSGTDTESSVVMDQLNIVIDARRWAATVTSAGTPPDIAALVTGEEFRSRFEEKFRLGVFVGRITLPSIDASFFGPLARKASTVDGRARNGVLLIGLNYTDATHNLVGDPEDLQDFARSNDVAGVVHADAVDVLLDDLHTRMVAGVADEGATLDSFSVRPRNGYFYVSGAVGKSEGTVNFTFRVVPNMFHTRPGAVFYARKTRRVHSRTWPALGFGIEGVETDVDRSWWVILFGEVLLGIVTVGMSILYVEDMVSAAAANFSGRIRGARPGAPAARIRRTIPPPGGIGVRIGLDQFDVTTDGTYVGISVRSSPTSFALYGPATIPSNYAGDTLRYLLRLPAGVTASDPALRVRWTLEDRTNSVVLADEDGTALGRLRLEFRPATFAGVTDFGVTVRLYRQLGATVTELGTESLNVHMRGPLPQPAYVRWRSQVSNPQIRVDEATDTWTYHGEAQINRWSEWHRTDAPCRAVNAPSRYRYGVEEADRLPFSLRVLEKHRKGLCPYCFYGGPGGINPSL
jgi:hypothetical protein